MATEDSFADIESREGADQSYEWEHRTVLSRATDPGNSLRRKKDDEVEPEGLD